MPESPEIEEVLTILEKTRKTGGGKFSEAEIDSFSRYYGLVLKWNRRLHLTTLTQPRAFVERHLCESELAASRLSNSVGQIWDLGTGLGIPGIPIAILSPHLPVTLVESNRGKVIFLEEAISELRLTNARVMGDRIESVDRFPQDSCLTARAVEKMDRMLPQLMIAGADCAQLMIYGTRKTESAINRVLRSEMKMTAHLISGSEQRFLFEIVPSHPGRE